MGKGSTRRPEAKPGAYAEGWDRTFKNPRKVGKDWIFGVGSVSNACLDPDRLVLRLREEATDAVCE